MLKNLIPRICRINVTPQAATMDSSSIIPALLHIMEYRRNRANTRTVVTVRITLYDVTALIYCDTHRYRCRAEKDSGDLPENEMQPENTPGSVSVNEW